MPILGTNKPTSNVDFRAQVVLFWTLSLALPVAILFNLEVWLQSSYTGGLFHREGFVYLYNTGIFRYRILGRVLLLKTYDLLLHVVPHTPFPMPRDTEGDLPFVLAYAVFNGISLVLTNFVLLCLLWVRRKGFVAQELSFYLFSFLLMSVSLAVVTPYDQLAYLLLVLTILAARLRRSMLAYVCVGVFAILGMLNRETEFLASSLLMTLALFTRGRQSMWYLRLTAVHFMLCLAVYVGLRLAIPGQANVSNSVLTFGGKWAFPAAVFVLGLFAATLVQARLVYASYRPAWVFCLLSLPYLALVVLTGVLRELRLLVPVILCVLCLYVTLHREEISPSRA